MADEPSYAGLMSAAAPDPVGFWERLMGPALGAVRGAGFGRVNPAVVGQDLAGAAGHLATLPQRAMGSAANFERTGQYDPAPIVEAASMMVGSPLTPRGALGSSMREPLYHGSPFADLTALQPSTRGPLGPGVYTSPAKQVADAYRGGGHTYELPQADRDIFRGLGHRTDAEWFGFKADKERLLAVADPEKRAALAGILEKTWSNDGYPAYQRIMQLYGGDEKAQALFKKAGFEGVSGLVDGPEVLLFGEQALR